MILIYKSNTPPPSVNFSCMNIFKSTQMRSTLFLEKRYWTIEPRYPEFDRTISDSPVLAFLGMDAVLKIIDRTNIALIYCLPGSKVQQIARDKGIPVRPLSEFQMEDA